MPSSTTRQWPRSVIVAAVLVSALSVCAILYWAQAVLIPLALASLLAFMLTPVVERLEGWGLGRIPSVVSIAVLLMLLTGAIGWSVGGQVGELAREIPGYEQNIKNKLADLRDMLKGGPIGKMQATFSKINEELEEEEPETNETVDTEPIPVQIKPAEGLVPASTSVSPVLEMLATAGLVFILVVFILIKREDLLNRVVSLAGVRSVAATTKALDEAKRRISRYLLMQFFLNAGYGTLLGITLWLVGVPYSLVWGFCGAVFRYVPYVGPLAAAVLPIAVSLTHFPGWMTALIVIAIIIALELVFNNLLEPWLYGSTVGLSEVAVILAAVFWTLLWGPLGLVLATPMTVCIVVLGKYIPTLAVFDRLLSEQPALQPHIWLYQRLLGRNEDDAEEIVLDTVAKSSLEATCQDVLIPTLALAKKEWMADRIDEDDQAAILDTLKDVIDALPVPPEEANEDESDATADPVQPASSGALVIGFPVGEADDLVLQLLERLLGKDRRHFTSLSSKMLIGERLAAIDQQQPVCVCLSSITPGDLMQTRQICKRLLANHPELKIVVGRWSASAVAEKNRDLLKSVGVDRTVATISEMLTILKPTLQFHSRHERVEA